VRGERRAGMEEGACPGRGHGIGEHRVAGTRLIAGGCIFIVMGCVHGLATAVDVFRPTHFAPADDDVRLAMRSTRVRFLRARANVWDAWLGFNLSHSLGMLVFGAATVWLGSKLGHIDGAKALLPVPFALGIAYLLLSLRFWFYLPTVAGAAASACFGAAWWRG
jgi:hypothetical protein